MENEQTEFENWLDEYEQTDREARAEQMKRHIEEAKTFAKVCADLPVTDPNDVNLLWLTWCIRRGIK